MDKNCRNSDLMDLIMGDQDQIVQGSLGYGLIRDFLITILIFVLILLPLWLPPLLTLFGIDIEA